ncbi:MAG: hypothetical protein ISS72_04195 [Candidatus Brocadiae bacterium]|nr:hypothetical protein [Candidatus Brocadiia bacterium]
MTGSTIGKRILFVLACVGATVPLRGSVKRAARGATQGGVDRRGDELARLARRSERFSALQHVRRAVPSDALVLVFRLNEFAYYARHKVISSWDPRMVGVYTQKDEKGVYRELLRLGVDYIYVPNYVLPTVGNTPVFRLLADPEVCDLVDLVEGYRLLRLLPARRRVQRVPIVLPNMDFSLRREEGNGPDWWSVMTKPERPPEGSWRLEAGEGGRPAVTIESDGRTKVRLWSGRGHYDAPPSTALWRGAPFDGRIDPELTYYFRARIRGRGHYRVDLLEYTDTGQLADILTLWSGVRARARAEEYRDIECLFRPSPTTAQCRLSVHVTNGARLSIQDIAIDQIVPAQGASRPGEAAP